ncbi:MAG: BlaI/MecI/CopY family transcriptional regulator [Planctomycetota bacterium]
MQRQPSGLQLAVLRVLWKEGSATVAEVQEALESDRPLAYSTLATVLARMTKSGLVTHTKDGRTFVYRAAISDQQTGQSLLKDLVGRMFSGSPAELVSYLLESEEVDSTELKRIKDLVDRHESGGSSKRKGGSRGR